MMKMIKELLCDCSTENFFYFTLRCGVCENEWHSRPIPYTKAGIIPLTDGKRIVFEALYQREKARARESAAKEGEMVFNSCPICGRLVCNDCFLVCADLDMCKECAARLDEQGEPVGNDGH